MYQNALRDIREVARQILDELDGPEPDTDAIYSLAEEIDERVGDFLSDEDEEGAEDDDGGDDEYDGGDEDENTVHDDGDDA